MFKLPCVSKLICLAQTNVSSTNVIMLSYIRLCIFYLHIGNLGLYMFYGKATDFLSLADGYNGVYLLLLPFRVCLLIREQWADLCQMPAFSSVPDQDQDVYRVATISVYNISKK